MDVLFNRRRREEDKKETEVNRAVHHISSCLKGGRFCLLHGNSQPLPAAGPTECPHSPDVIHAK